MVLGRRVHCEVIRPSRRPASLCKSGILAYGTLFSNHPPLVVDRFNESDEVLIDIQVGWYR